MDKPSRCIDPIIKFCQGCLFGSESGCSLGFDKGRPEDEPTEEELKEFIRRYFPENEK